VGTPLVVATVSCVWNPTAIRRFIAIERRRGIIDPTRLVSRLSRPTDDIGSQRPHRRTSTRPSERATGITRSRCSSRADFHINEHRQSTTGTGPAYTYVPAVASPRVGARGGTQDDME